jgi:c-di-GMP phosphodiesterase
MTETKKGRLQPLLLPEKIPRRQISALEKPATCDNNDRSIPYPPRGAAMSTYYVHKEPVLDRKRCLFGNELSFRKSTSAQKGSRWPVLNVDEHVVDAVSADVGFERLTGNKRTFLNLDVAVAKMEMLALLPKSSVLQIPERDAVDKEVLLKAAMLKRQSYQLAIDYTPSARGLLPLHKIADFVRIDGSPFAADAVASAVATFKGLPARLIAGHVEDSKSFLLYRDLGFELFQGPFLMKPSGDESLSISSSQEVLLQLFNDLRANRDIAVIERTFKNSPKLAYGLLQLMNSAFFRAGRKVASLGQAITLLGYENLQKWVVLLLFTVDRRDAQSHPLIEKALTRSKLMESLAKKTGEWTLADSAFITGMLSFMNVFFNLKPEEVTSKLNLVQEIQDALVRREGILGTLLMLAEKTDRQEYEGMDEEAKALKLSAEDVLWAETNAIVDSEKAFEN